MKKSRLFAAVIIPIIIVGFFRTPSLYAEDIPQEEGDLLSVAIMDIAVSGNIVDEDHASLQELFSSAIEETGVFRLVERSSIDEILGEISFQQSGLLDEDRMAELGKLDIAEYLLFGSIGSLFDKIVLSAKLVDIERGRVAIARTLTTDKERFFSDLDKFAITIASAAIDLNLKVTADMIDTAIEDQDYPRAKNYLDRYIAENGIDPRARRFREKIIPNLAESYAQEADNYRSEKKYKEALGMVQQAIALRIDESYINLRDQILREEEEFLEKAKQEEERKRQREEARRLRYERMLEDGQTSLVAAYLANISVLGHHIATLNEWPITDNYELPSMFGTWGIEYFNVSDPLKLTGEQPRHRGTERVNRAAYMGANLQYDRDTPSGNNLVAAEIYLSPYTTRGFKIVNLVLLLGIDAGAGMRFSRDIPGGMDWYATGGLTASVEIKLRDRFGFFFMVKGKYNWFPKRVGESEPRLRATAGLVL